MRLRNGRNVHARCLPRKRSKLRKWPQELKAAQDAVGSGVDVASFTQESLRGLGATISGKDTLKFDLRETPRALRDVLNRSSAGDVFEARFELPIEEGQLHLVRTHPLVESLSSYILETALDPLSADQLIKTPARRCGAIRTAQVERRMTLLLLRFRYHIITTRGREEIPLLAEDCQVLAFAGSPQNAEWLNGATAERLLGLIPDSNINPIKPANLFGKSKEDLIFIRPHLDEVAIAAGRGIAGCPPACKACFEGARCAYRSENLSCHRIFWEYMYFLPKV